MIGFLKKTWESFKTSSFTEGLANLLAPVIARIEGADVDETRKALKQDFSRARKKLPDRQAQIDAETAADQAQIEKDRKAQQDVLATNKAKDDKDLAAAIAQDQADLAAAKKDLADSVEAARKKRAEAESKKPGEAPTAPKKPELPPLPDPKKFGQGLGAGLATAKASVSGTFSAFAAGGLGAGDTRRIARATEETARQVKIVAKRLPKGPWGLAQFDT
ncbi:MAG: hypothetical protein JW818_09830 [Pirellulales bacterium]|nr:hypothetical protein [Pirellulales bacterium]